MKADLKNTAAVILAAGRGSRMNAKNKNKVAFVLAGEPMIKRAVDSLRKAGIGELIAVVGFARESVEQALGDSVKYVEQKNQLGTGDALKVALPSIPDHITSVLSVYGDDSAFYPPELYVEMVKKLEDSGASLLFLTIHKDNPFGLGRIVRDSSGKVLRIVEEKNATEEEKNITEINTGFYCFRHDFLRDYIDQIKQNDVSGEYYLTDMVEIALGAGKSVETHLADATIWHGVNNRSDFAKARAKLKK